MTHKYKAKGAATISRFQQVPKSQVRKAATALNKIRKQTGLSIYSMAYDIEISSCTLWKVFDRFSATVQTIEKINKYLEWAK